MSIWQRPGLSLSSPFDTILFDVDGVLIDTTRSFRATNIAVTEYITKVVRGLGGRAEVLITTQDDELFKQAGGFNNDWDLSYLLTALTTARLREWRSSPLGRRSVQEWAELARIAHLEGRGGRAWVDATFPVTAMPDYSFLLALYQEYYWGAEELERRFQRHARYFPDAPGVVRQEELLLASDLPARLLEAGIRHMGIITGRIGPEIDSALERLAALSGERWWDVVIGAELCAKPDPQAMRLALEAVGGHNGLYIGDTADDYDLVANYLHIRQAGEPQMLSAMCVPPQEHELYQQRGADLIVTSVNELPACVALLS